MPIRGAVAAALLLAAAVSAAAATRPAPRNRAADAALLKAIAGDDADGVQAALKAVADPNPTDAEGTPALVAVFQASGIGVHRRQIVQALLAAKANASLAAKDGLTPLAAAIDLNSDWDLVGDLIKAGADVNVAESDGWTPLHHAAAVGNSSALDALIAAKARVDAADKDGWTPFYLALNQGKGSIARRLSAAGATPRVPAGRFPLVAAAAAGHDPGAVRLALDLGADVNAATDKGYTALMIAAFNDRGQMVMDLLRAGADTSLKNKEGRTALDVAQVAESKEAVALLGGPWPKPALGPAALQVDCPVLGGKVAAHVTVEGEDVVVRTAFPRPLSYYLGGGMVNRADSAKKLTYEGTAAPSYFFDTDNNARTGFAADPLEAGKQGAEIALTYSEMITTVQVGWVDEKGETQRRSVSGDVLSPSVDTDKGDIEGHYPAGENEAGVLKTTIPLSAFAVKAGQPAKLTATVGRCGPVTARVRIK
ncbi:MAG TPA: ankyrin repeat domain-containing protein [Vicinamibacteria bacterium]|nr:ankyrin repeat domain-containing protein [Vicinamibacteria bacterium]